MTISATLETSSPYLPSRAMHRMQWIALVLLVLSGTVNYLDRSALAIANPEIRRELGLDATQMGVLLSTFLMSYAACQLPAGLLVDRIGPRKLLGFGIVIWSVAQAAVGFVVGFGQFWWARIFLGVGEAPQYPTGARVVSDWFNVRDRGLPTGLFNASSQIGPALAPPLLTGLMLAFGWREMFIIMGVIGLLVAVAWFVAYRSPAGYATDDDIAHIRSGDALLPPITLGSWARLFRFQITWGMVIGNFCITYLTYIYFAWLPGFLEILHHISIERTGIYAMIPPFFGIFGSIVGGMISDRLARHGVSALTSRRIPLIGGIVAMAIGTFATAYSDSFTWVMIFLSATIFFATLTSCSVWALVTAAAPQNYVGSIGSIQNLGGSLGGACSPIITGIIVDATGSFVIPLVVGGLISLLGALIYLLAVTRPITQEQLVEALPISVTDGAF